MALVCGMALALGVPAWAQEGGLRLGLSKQFGFALGGQIQGTFKLTAQGPADLTSVTFRLDDEAGVVGPTILGEVSEAPFSLTFGTDQYPHGRYELSATGQTAGGQTIQSNVLHVEFVSAAAGWQATGRLVVPLLVLFGAIMLLASVGPLVLERLGMRPRRPVGAPRNYGLLGGTVCPKCGRPFGLHWWAPNLIVNKFDRCPHCGKWSVVGRASREALTAAEAAETEAATPEVPEPSPEEKLRRQIEDSRYM
jgi:hypothetical protein